MANVGVALVGSGNPVGRGEQFVIGVDGHILVESGGTGKSDRRVGQLLDHLFVSQFDIIAAYNVAELDVVDLTITAHERSHRLFINHEEKRLHQFVSGNAEKFADFFHGVRAGGGDFLKGRTVGSGHVVASGRGYLGFLKIRSEIAGFARRDGVFTGLGKHHELVGKITADLAGVGLNRLEAQADAGKGRLVCFEHLEVGLFCTFLVLIKGIGILHDEFAAAHQAEAGTDFITEFGLNLVQVDRQLLVGLDLAAHEVGDDFFVRGSEAVVTAVTVVQAQKFLTVKIPTSGFTPEVGGLHHGHEHFHGTGTVHFLAYDLGDLVDGTQAERQVIVDAAGQLADHARTHQQFVGNDLGISRIFLESGNVIA